MRRAAELRAAALQRKQQEQQARQQQQNLLKMNKKKVQNAIKTQQRKGVVLKTTVNTPVTYKPTVTAPVPIGALRRTLPVVRPVVPAKPPGIRTVGLTPQMKTQIVPRTIVTSASSPTPYVQRLQPKPQVTQRAYTPSVPTQISRANTSAAVPGGYAATTGNSHGSCCPVFASNLYVVPYGLAKSWICKLRCKLKRALGRNVSCTSLTVANVLMNSGQRATKVLRRFKVKFYFRASWKHPPPQAMLFFLFLRLRRPQHVHNIEYE